MNTTKEIEIPVNIVVGCPKHNGSMVRIGGQCAGKTSGEPCEFYCGIKTVSTLSQSFDVAKKLICSCPVARKIDLLMED